VKVTATIGLKTMLEAIEEQLGELEEIEEFLGEHDYECAHGVAHAIKEMHVELRERLEEQIRSISFLRRLNETQDLYIGQLEEAVIQAERAFEAGVPNDERDALVDRVRMQADKAKERQKNADRKKSTDWADS
jgi:hypothetical protein